MKPSTFARFVLALLGLLAYAATFLIRVDTSSSWFPALRPLDPLLGVFLAVVVAAGLVGVLVILGLIWLVKAAQGEFDAD